MKKLTAFFNLFLFLTVSILLFSCSSINFNEESPLAKDFKPKAVVILPSIKMPEGVDFDAEKLAKIIYDELIKMKKFDRVVEPKDALATLSANQELQSNMLNYITKLRTLNISDADLSKKIGEAYGVQALIVVEASKWGYTKVLGEKTAEVSITLKMIDAETGNVVWKASHSDQEQYSIFKPELTDMAKDIVHKIMKHLPQNK